MPSWLPQVARFAGMYFLALLAVSRYAEGERLLAGLFAAGALYFAVTSALACDWSFGRVRREHARQLLEYGIYRLTGMSRESFLQVIEGLFVAEGYMVDRAVDPEGEVICLLARRNDELAAVKADRPDGPVNGQDMMAFYHLARNLLPGVTDVYYITTTSFTPQAKGRADKIWGLHLVDGRGLIDWINRSEVEEAGA